jgi:hypothetical protein
MVGSSRRLARVALLVALAALWPRGVDAQGLTTAIQGAPGAPTAPWFVTLVPSTAGNGFKKFAVTGETTTVQTVKSGLSNLQGWYISNVDNAAASCVQFFDKGSNATITLGTTVPDFVLKIPANSAANLQVTGGIAFTSGIRLAAATTCVGSTAPASGLDISIWYF